MPRGSTRTHKESKYDVTMDPRFQHLSHLPQLILGPKVTCFLHFGLNINFPSKSKTIILVHHVDSGPKNDSFSQFGA